MGRIILAGKYEVREEIAQGGMGVIYKAFDLRLERDVVIKQDVIVARDGWTSKFLTCGILVWSELLQFIPRKPHLPPTLPKIDRGFWIASPP
ncbi:MAG: hypothetical protein P0119_02130 [Nitrospira sp.]|nr:hypothetical protein [Nitrospira sp.]